MVLASLLILRPPLRLQRRTGCWAKSRFPSNKEGRGFQCPDLVVGKEIRQLPFNSEFSVRSTGAAQSSRDFNKAWSIWNDLGNGAHFFLCQYKIFKTSHKNLSCVKDGIVKTNRYCAEPSASQVTGVPLDNIRDFTGQNIGNERQNTTLFRLPSNDEPVILLLV